MLGSGEQLRFDDRSPHSLRVGLSIKPPVLRRQTIGILAALMVAGVIYGTLVPFNFEFAGPWRWRLPLMRPQPGDTLANVLVYVPVGILLRLLLRRRGSWAIVECTATVLAALGISYSAEFLQQWLPGRVPTITDTASNVLGAFIGALAAPTAQRGIRWFHAWLYQAMQTTPFTALAGLLGACICAYALAPFDIHPTPTHVLSRLDHLHASWQAGLMSPPELSPPALLNKWVAAGACGTLAFLLTMAAREKGRSRLTSAYAGLLRSCGLVVLLETVQLFTVSHVADFGDLARGWACCVLGVSTAGLLLWFRPLIYRDPMALVGPVVPLVCPVLVAWWAMTGFREVGGGAAGRTAWLPVMGNFNRSWDSLLAGYTTGLINYVLAVGAFVIWLRVRGHVPRLAHCLGAGLLAALTLQVVALVFFGAFPDTAHIALAILAAGLVHRFDRAMDGRRVTSCGNR